MLDIERVGVVGVETGGLGDPAGEEAEAAGDQDALDAPGVHRVGHLAGTLGQPDAAVIDLLQRGFRQPLEHADPLAERGLEIKFAAHRPFGDGGDLILDADGVSQFVDAFVFDDRGVHVRDQQADGH